MKDKNSKLEMIFWSTILVLALIYIGLQFAASSYIKKSDSNSTKQTTIVPPRISSVIKEFIVDDNSIKHHLEENSTTEYIDNGLHTSIEHINTTIDKRVEELFKPVYDKIDTFLDFHYSVIGEYTELGLAATGKIEESIKDRLFGSQFDKSLSKTTLHIESRFISELDAHKKLIENHITQDIDKELNINLLNTLKRDINSSISTQKNKIATMLGIGVSYKVIVATLSTKLAAKLSSKLAIKGAVKGGSKLGAAGIGAATGAICGPAAIVCSPLLAITAWFGTDAILVTGDEYLHRDEFKQEITQSIDQQKQSLKDEYKKIYRDALNKESSHIIKMYKDTHIKKKIRKRVREYVTDE
ncbi:hypothetical protein MNB_SV-6-1635 [hydrothermal vent metagenome]|uniref:Uncharacterized protein n=1 Tax=hydrothermal vent metagenome TaxID=652676 RepID=A0A1W1BR94_9ZZZZ